MTSLPAWLAWLLAAYVMFVPGLVVAAVVWREKRRHIRLRGRIGYYGHLAPK